jgi:hypothetical protein
MIKILDFQEGLEKSIEIIEGIKERPGLVAVYGLPNGGKTYFMRKIGDYFEPKGTSVTKDGGGPDHSDFERILESPEYLRDVIMFHCAWERIGKTFDNQDPNFLAKDILNRKINLNVGIYNPSIYRAPNGEYDLIISNPKSTRKHPIDPRNY